MLFLLKVAFLHLTLSVLSLDFHFTGSRHLRRIPQFHMPHSQLKPDPSLSYYTWLSTHCDASRMGCPATKKSVCLKRAREIILIEEK